jgi:hypothetical protein
MKSLKELVLVIGMSISFVFVRIFDFVSDVVGEWRRRKRYTK